MAYNTQYRGKLKFKKDITVKQLRKLNSYLGEDCRQHPNWKRAKGLYHIKLELLPDFSGICWDGSEKTDQMVETVNFLIDEMRDDDPEFGLTGKLDCQGEEIGDVWVLTFDENGKAIRVENPPVGEKIRCPHCREEFYWNG